MCVLMDVLMGCNVLETSTVETIMSCHECIQICVACMGFVEWDCQVLR